MTTMTRFEVGQRVERRELDDLPIGTTLTETSYESRVHVKIDRRMYAYGADWRRTHDRNDVHHAHIITALPTANAVGDTVGSEGELLALPVDTWLSVRGYGITRKTEARRRWSGITWDELVRAVQRGEATINTIPHGHTLQGVPATAEVTTDTPVETPADLPTGVLTRDQLTALPVGTLITTTETNPICVKTADGFLDWRGNHYMSGRMLDNGAQVYQPEPFRTEQPLGSYDLLQSVPVGTIIRNSDGSALFQKYENYKWNNPDPRGVGYYCARDLGLDYFILRVGDTWHEQEYTEGAYVQSAETLAFMEPGSTIRNYSGRTYTKNPNGNWTYSGGEYDNGYLARTSQWIVAAILPQPVYDQSILDMMQRVRRCIDEVVQGQGTWGFVRDAAWIKLGVDDTPAIGSTINQYLISEMPDDALFRITYGTSWYLAKKSTQELQHEVVYNAGVVGLAVGDTRRNDYNQTCLVLYYGMAIRKPEYISAEDFLHRFHEEQASNRARHAWCSAVVDATRRARLDDPGPQVRQDAPVTVGMTFTNATVAVVARLNATIGDGGVVMNTTNQHPIQFFSGEWRDCTDWSETVIEGLNLRVVHVVS